MHVPEEKIMSHLAMLLDGSAPGAMLHHMHVVAAPAGSTGPLGVPDPEKLATAVYAIDATGDGVDPEQFIARTVLAALADHAKRGDRVLFAAVAQEVWSVPELDELARRLLAAGEPLGEHPEAVESTMVYGVCADGRRWRGRRWLTGPDAGRSLDVELLVGRRTPGEGFGMAAEPYLWRLVGLTS